MPHSNFIQSKFIGHTVGVERYHPRSCSWGKPIVQIVIQVSELTDSPPVRKRPDGEADIYNLLHPHMFINI